MVETLRIWFFTDIHGSTALFRKFLNTPQNSNKPNVIIVGGDVTGKQLVPIVELSEGLYRIGGVDTAVTSKELPEIKLSLENSGHYLYECTPAQQAKLEQDGAERDAVFNKLVRDRLHEWVKLADAKLPTSDVCQAFFNAGNDDPFYVDKIIDKSARLIRPEGRLINLPCGYMLASTGYSNITPWKCPRDESEKQLERRIARLLQPLPNEFNGKLIFNFHCPPSNTALDLATRIDVRQVKRIPSVGSDDRVHVGSTAVRQAIEAWQPIASFHGHIHESPAIDTIGDAICLNPGSTYQGQTLSGAFVKMTSDGKVLSKVLTSERQLSAASEQSDFFRQILKMVPVVGEKYRSEESEKRLKEIHAALTAINEKLGDGHKRDDI